MNLRVGGVFRLLVASSILSTAWCGAATTDTIRVFDIPSGDAEKTLRQFSVQSGMEVLYPTDAAKGIKTHAVKGRRAIAVAVEQMLTGTPLRAVKDQKHDIWRVVRVADPNAGRAAQNPSSDRPAMPTIHPEPRLPPIS